MHNRIPLRCAAASRCSSQQVHPQQRRVTNTSSKARTPALAIQSNKPCSNGDQIHNPIPQQLSDSHSARSAPVHPDSRHAIRRSTPAARHTGPARRRRHDDGSLHDDGSPRFPVLAGFGCAVVRASVARCKGLVSGALQMRRARVRRGHEQARYLRLSRYLHRCILGKGDRGFCTAWWWVGGGTAGTLHVLGVGVGWTGEWCVWCCRSRCGVVRLV